ncbi:methyltransferase [Flammeovirga yaeyamensis]|uniref:Methyltransferase n=1 Tax=Flammeovirga yaeyamensis TaxID=367791 RepID=A0AAX1NCW1_9BACT|nr:methyltransferase [Flammeovirga yaeyamensis]MBB3696734.1 tRNA G10 N-methylase Trm11 [Flammeovirga yaeyamensis]NMF33404.1 methyltransferase [Flammeovirga yaeyamensis]QWG05322.1 methyltransferase [Flammeovirga yaeyamensis]
MQSEQFLYLIKYNSNETQLCRLETKLLFNQELEGNHFFSDIEFEPDHSAFIKKRVEILIASSDYDELLLLIKSKKIHVEGFKLEYIKLKGDDIEYRPRLDKLRDIGYIISGEPDYYHPTITYALFYQSGVYYFGKSVRDDAEWQQHNNKPCSFSNSLSMNTAKTLVNIASFGDKSKRLIDTCCGVGTVMLEGCYGGYTIEGCDINIKSYHHTLKNLDHYGYKAEVYHSDIKDLDQQYDAAIIDLPYNLYSASTDEIMENIIASASKIAKRLVIVSIADIKEVIDKYGLKLVDFSTVDKVGKVKFTRNVWVCEK